MTFKANFDVFVLTCLVVGSLCTEDDIKTDRLACPVKDYSQQPPDRVDTTQKLAAIRNLLSENDAGIEAILVTSEDEHQTEMVSDSDKRREYVSGFSGSTGQAIITVNKAALWTDGRYHLEADEQLDCNWLLMREGNAHVPTQSTWLHQQFPQGAKIGVDPKLIPEHKWEKLESELKTQNGNFTLVEMQPNLIDQIWIKQPDEGIKRAYVLDDIYTGKHWTEKVDETREHLNQLGAEAMVVTALDEVAWLLNVRGWDVPNNGLLKSYVLLSQDEVILYVDLKKIKENITNCFEKQHRGKLKFREHDDIFIDLPIYSQNWTKILVPSFCGFSPGASKKIYSLVPKSKLVSKPSPIIYLKAKKNPTEILGMEKAHIRDGAALCKFFEYFESSIKKGEVWDELKVVAEVDRFRFEQPLIVTPSFSTISAFGAHGAHPHYKATPITSIPILNNSTLVIDSGGQYYDGTTDVTRTVHLGNPTDEEKQAYTRVLIGSIELSNLIFPDNLNSSDMDTIARAPLWEIGYDYAHGTSHGIGSFLNVHESPTIIRYNSPIPREPLGVGYFLSNEPGVYLSGKFGIRLENVMEVVKKPHLKQQRGHSFLGFKVVTLVPYDTKLIDFDLLDVKHRRWLNKYNQQIRQLVGAELQQQNATDAYNWMLSNTEHIPDRIQSFY